MLDGVPEIPEIPAYVGTCLRYSLLADGLPRWYLPEESGQGGDAVGEGGGQGGWEGGYARCQPASQQASIASSAQCQSHSQRQCDPRFPVSVLKVYLTLSVSHPAPRPFLLIPIISKTCHRAQISLSRCRCI